MPDNCANCFFSVTAPATAGDRFAGSLYCAFNAPVASSGNQNAWLWPLVETDWWCGEGINEVTLTPFRAPVTPPPSVPGGNSTSGTFDLSAQASATVTASGCLAASTVQTWCVSLNGGDTKKAPNLDVTPGSGSFDVATEDSSAVTGTWGYTVYNGA